MEAQCRSAGFRQRARSEGAGSVELMERTGKERNDCSSASYSCNDQRVSQAVAKCGAY